VRLPANEIVAPTRQVVLFSVMSAALAVAATAVASYHRPVPWTALLSGLIVALAGFQIANAHRIFGFRAPSEVRPWMIPASRVCYAIGVVLALLGVRALMLHAIAA
jgi:hypothetical protein